MSSKDADVVIAARELRAKLAKAYPAVKFSVRSSRFAGGEAIDVEWIDGPTEDKVGSITRPYESVRRDAFGEILGGGNRYIGIRRDFSQRARAWARSEVAKLPFTDETVAWQLLVRTTFDASGRPHTSSRR